MIDQNNNNDVTINPVNRNKKSRPRRFFSIGRVLSLIVVLTAILGVYFSIHYYHQYQSLKVASDVEMQKEVDTLVAKIATIMELPTDETPTVATITDVEKLKDQAFFKNTKNGDKLLAFTKAMQAILYRPSTNKIIAVAPIVINQNQSQSQDITAKNDGMTTSSKAKK